MTSFSANMIYLLLDDRQRVQDTFAAALTDRSAQFQRAMDGIVIAGRGAVMAHPLSWSRTSTKPLEWQRMMPRHELERWVHAHFFKLCLPFPRPEWDDNLVFAPLNLSFVFRLVAHLHRRGYPAHWLSGILSTLSTGKITTQARAPRSMVLDAESVRRVHPPRKMSIGPFLAEFRTIFSLWRRLLPFGTPLADEDVMPSLHSIYEYKMSFRSCDGLDKLRITQISHAVFLLVFSNKSIVGAPPRAPSVLRDILLDDEDSVSEHHKFHSTDGSVFPIHVLSTWTWKRETSVATFWFSNDVVENILEQPGDWEAYIWRSDTWKVALGPLPLSKDILVQGRSWC